MTYIGAAILGVLGWFAAHFIAGPVLDYRKLRSEITQSLILYANVAQSQTERWNEATRVYREQASALMGCANALILSSLLAKLHVIPSIDDLQEVKANLIGLSNAIGLDGEGLNNSRRQETIVRILRIRT